MTAIPGTQKKPDLLTPTETHSVLFEWPLSGLKSIFDSSRGDVKSTLIESPLFDGGRWSVFFYANSGFDQYCSMYLTAHPLPDERTAAATSTTTTQGSENDDDKDQKPWSREALYHFKYSIETPDRKKVLVYKEASNHVFSDKTSNWGWAQFVKRDLVYYGNDAVKEADKFIITVSISSVAAESESDS